MGVPSERLLLATRRLFWWVWRIVDGLGCWGGHSLGFQILLDGRVDLVIAGLVYCGASWDFFGYDGMGFSFLSLGILRKMSLLAASFHSARTSLGF